VIKNRKNDDEQVQGQDLTMQFSRQSKALWLPHYVLQHVQEGLHYDKGAGRGCLAAVIGREGSQMLEA
jgi:hypothetical protein